MNTIKPFNMTDNNLQFIREKIYAVRSAIMYSLSNEIIHLPNSIVTAVKVDDEGQLWFLCDRPAYNVDHCAQAFPARLKFYKKGTSFHLEVSGRAQIVVNDDHQAGDNKQPLLIRMDIRNVEYTDVHEKRKNNIEVHLEKGYKWVLKNIGFTRSDKPVLSRLQSLNSSTFN